MTEENKDVNKIEKALTDRIKKDFFKSISEANIDELQYVLSRETLATLWDNWRKTNEEWEKNKSKMAYYFSAEFLMGRWMGNAIINLKMDESCQDACKKLGINYNDLEDAEKDAGLGNGGLGRLAACFLDSLATLDMPAMGYGIRYKYGMFEQKIINNKQTEVPDNWLKNGDLTSIERYDEAVVVKFGGNIDSYVDEKGHNVFRVINAEEVVAHPFDMPVPGYDTKTVITLRLWQARSTNGFDLDLFQNEQYDLAVAKGNRAKDISRVLYPNDHGVAGKTLRLKQQYFFVSASIQDLLRRYKRVWGKDLSNLPNAIAIQMNDTHPVIAIAELMRILVDEEGLAWEEASDLTMKCCAYTNHTILAEALEKWPIDIFARLLPRHYQIIEEINHRFTTFLKQSYGNDPQKIRDMSIIADGVVKMAWLAIVASHSVNGVAALHTEILKKTELKNWFEVFPEKFNNKTNGVTQRRWLLKSNPALASLITSKIGNEWTKNMETLEAFGKFNDKETLAKIDAIKIENKKVLAAYIKQHNGVDIDINSIFDVQVKRLHEYKRQLLNVLHIMLLYKRLKADPNLDVVPRTFIFGAKAASGYRQAKLIIELINTLGSVINNDASIKGKIKVVFLENYRVSLAEKIFPASDISEQISTAGYEASGTGNMKFMMNGALTMGTMDGANIEIVEAAGKENAFIFGLTSDEVFALKGNYNTNAIISHDKELEEVLGMLISEPINPAGSDLFRPIYNSLVYGIEGNSADHYFILKDFRSYVEAQARAEKLYRDKDAWLKTVLINISKSGRFSSDRTIKEYCNEIWNIKPVKF